MFGSEGEPVRTERTDKEVKWLTRNAQTLNPIMLNA